MNKREAGDAKPAVVLMPVQMNSYKAGIQTVASGPLGNPAGVHQQGNGAVVATQDGVNFMGAVPRRGFHPLNLLPEWAQTPNFPAAQRISNYAMVVLQYMCLAPGILLAAFLILQDVLVYNKDQVWKQK